MDFSLTPEQDAFREQVRAWLKENIPRDWSRRVMASAEVPRPEAYQFLRDWQRTLFDAGFVGLTWPKEYGGRGLTFMEELILHEEMALAKAPQILNILGIHLGTMAVQQRPDFHKASPTNRRSRRRAEIHALFHQL